MAVRQDRVHRAGKPVDLRAFNLVAGVVEEMGNAPHSHSVDTVRRQRQEGLEVGRCIHQA